MLDLLVVFVIALFAFGLVLKLLGKALETAGNVYRWASEDPDLKKYRHAKPYVDTFDREDSYDD